MELLEAAPELAVYGREEERCARLRDADRRWCGSARRDALADGAADGLGLWSSGLTVAGVLAVAVSATPTGSSTAC